MTKGLLGSAMANQIENSPIGIAEVNLWGQCPETVGPAFAKVGNKGNVFVSGRSVYGLAEASDDELVFCWFDDNHDRHDSGVRTKCGFQTINLNESGQALVLGGDGDAVYAIDSSGRATCLGVAVDTIFKQAAWLGSGFALVTFDGELHVYAWTDEIDPVPLGRYTAVQFDDIRAVGDDVIVACRTDLHVLSMGTDVRTLAQLEVPYSNTYQCTDESGRSFWILPGAHVSDGGAQFEVTHLADALARRDDFPELERAGSAAALAPGDDIEVPDTNAASPEFRPRVPVQSPYWTYTNALLAMMKEKGTLRDQPLPGVIECLTMPLAEELYAYIFFRAHYDVGVVAVYEAWLDAPPRLVDGVIELGTLANGDRIIARDRKVFEVAHDEDDEREFYSMESWLANVVQRTDEGTDLDPYLAQAAAEAAAEVAARQAAAEESTETPGDAPAAD